MVTHLRPLPLLPDYSRPSAATATWCRVCRRAAPLAPKWPSAILDRPGFSTVSTSGSGSLSLWERVREREVAPTLAAPSLITAGRQGPSPCPLPALSQGAQGERVPGSQLVDWASASAL